MTYPMVPRMGSVGRLNTGDGQLSIWNVAWVSRALVVAPNRLYDTNIFYPHDNTLAFSESNIGAGLLGVPGYWLTKNPFVAHNSAMAIGFSMTFIATFLLVRHVSASAVGAWVGAIAFTFCPFIFARTAHSQLMLAAGLPASLWCFYRLLDLPSLGRSVSLACVLVGQALMCAYYGIFAAMLMGCATFYYAWQRRLWSSLPYWRGIAIAGALSVAGIAPFFKPYLDLQSGTGFARTLEDAAMYSADWQAWLASAAWSHRWLHPVLGSWSEVLFPGFLTTVLGVAGWAVAWRRAGAAGPAAAAGSEATASLTGATERRMRGDDRDEGPGAIPSSRETAGFFGSVAAIATWASFGPSAGLYTVLHNTIPVFSFLRAPARFGLIVSLCLAVLLAFAVEAMVSRVPRHALALSIGLPFLMTAELFTAPLALQTREPVNPAYRMLATLRYGPVAEFPFFYLRSDFPRHAAYMLNSTAHWQPLINGYSDHIPQDFRDMVVPMSSFPTRESFRLLQDRRARYVVFHLNWYDRRSRERLLERLQTYREFLAPLSQVDDVWLYEITRWP